MKHQNSLRIIGGKWRSRKVSFADRAEIRPTGDRIRETLFNWLMHDVSGARCLDLFAGSGILGLEALSRGAASVTFVEYQREIADHLRDNLATLAEDNYEVLNTSADDYLKQAEQTFDLVFLDPPFGTGHLIDAITTINERQLSTGMIYVESNDQSIFGSLPEGWQIHRQKNAGEVCYGLIRMP